MAADAPPPEAAKPESSSEPRTGAPLPRETPALAADPAPAHVASPERKSAPLERLAEPGAPREGAPPPAPSSERAAEILKQVRLQLSPELRQATIQLEPESLGRISIRIAVRRGQASTEVRAERVETLDALQRHLPELRAALAQHGIDSGELDLGLGFQRERERAPASESSNSAARRRTGTRIEPAEVLRSAAARAVAGELGIDTYA